MVSRVIIQKRIGDLTSIYKLFFEKNLLYHIHETSMDSKDLNTITEELKSKNQLFLMDQKLLRPQIEGVPINFEKYRSKMVKDEDDNIVLTVNYDNSPTSDQPARGFARIAQAISGLLNFKVGDNGGMFYYTVTDGNLMANTHKFRIADGDGNRDLFSAEHKFMALAKQMVEVSDLNGQVILKSEYRGYRKLIEIHDSSGNLVANLHAPIISMRDRWKMEFMGDVDRILVVIMAAIMSEMGER